MELDTRASESAMAGKLIKRSFPGVFVEASGVMLHSYSGQLSQVQKQPQVSVRFGYREATLPLYFTKGSSPTLLGRNWIYALGFRLPEYQKAVLHVVKDVPSLPRPLPFALKDGVTQELQRLQREGILVPVKTSEWATPLDPVLKRDGTVRICGDFKVAINPVVGD
ncbi:hypothetical protein HPB49_026318 [Dermacentor silvarum]|nr:hypothetical protein HPB49_026318 [Dermacentor silvarum]